LPQEELGPSEFFNQNEAISTVGQMTGTILIIRFFEAMAE
jgi:hypothetical protein